MAHNLVIETQVAKLNQCASANYGLLIEKIWFKYQNSAREPLRILFSFRNCIRGLQLRISIYLWIIQFKYSNSVLIVELWLWIEIKQMQMQILLSLVFTDASLDWSYFDV